MQYDFKQFVFMGKEIHILQSDNRSEEKVRKYFPLLCGTHSVNFWKFFQHLHLI
jgi:hypothetical protein